MPFPKRHECNRNERFVARDARSPRPRPGVAVGIGITLALATAEIRAETIAPGVEYSISGGYHVLVADVTNGVAVRVNSPQVGSGSVDFDTVVNHALTHGAFAAINANYFDSVKGGTCGAARGDGEQFSSYYSESGCRTTLGWGPLVGDLMDSYGHEGDSGFHPDLTNLVTGGGVVLASGSPPTWPQLAMPMGRAMTAFGVSLDRTRFVLVVCDAGESSLMEMEQVLSNHGAADAVFLDGGGSSRMWIEGKGYVNAAEGSDRLVPVAILVVPDTTPEPDGGPTPDGGPPEDGGNPSDGAPLADGSPGGDGDAEGGNNPWPPAGDADSGAEWPTRTPARWQNNCAATQTPPLGLLFLMFGGWTIRQRMRTLGTGAKSQRQPIPARPGGHEQSDRPAPGIPHRG